MLFVSSRTIRNDIKILDQTLQQNGANILGSRGYGYRLQVFNDEKFKTFIEGLMFDQDRVPVEPEDRVKFLVDKFLLSTNYLKIEDITEELFVSRSTLQNDLRDVKVILNKYGLHLDKRPNYGLKITGDEKDIRFAISEEIYKRDFAKPTQNKYSESMFLSTEQIDIIHQIVLSHMRETDINLSDIALSNLVIHIAIACKRIEQDHYVSSNSISINEIIDSTEYSIAIQLLKEVEKELDLSFPDEEIYYVTMHLLGTKIFSSQHWQAVTSQMDASIVETVRLMIQQVSHHLKLDLENDHELFAGIAVHLKPTIHRYRYGMNIRNPILDAIKENYPLAFEAGVIAGKVIEDHQNITVNENEIGYLALHFGAAMERTKLDNKRKKCLIVCTTGIGSSQLLLYKLRTNFSNKLDIIRTTELHNLNLYIDEVDFIISTVPLPSDIHMPHVVVSTILGEQDIHSIEQHIDNKRNNVVEKYLESSNIFMNQPLTSPTEVIQFLGEQLIDKGIVRSNFIESVLERERAAPTSYGNLVAIPHPLEPQSNQTFWSFCILNEPFNGEKTQFK